MSCSGKSKSSSDPDDPDDVLASSPKRSKLTPKSETMSEDDDDLEEDSERSVEYADSDWERVRASSEFVKELVRARKERYALESRPEGYDSDSEDDRSVDRNSEQYQRYRQQVATNPCDLNDFPRGCPLIPVNLGLHRGDFNLHANSAIKHFNQKENTQFELTSVEKAIGSRDCIEHYITFLANNFFGPSSFCGTQELKSAMYSSKTN